MSKLLSIVRVLLPVDPVFREKQNRIWLTDYQGVAEWLKTRGVQLTDTKEEVVLAVVPTTFLRMRFVMFPGEGSWLEINENSEHADDALRELPISFDDIARFVGRTFNLIEDLNCSFEYEASNILYQRLDIVFGMELRLHMEKQIQVDIEREAWGWDDHPRVTTNYIKRVFCAVVKIENAWIRCQKRLTRKVNIIKKAWLDAYYMPTRAICRKRLHRELVELQGLNM